MAFVCPSLPDTICRNLLSSFLACFDGNQVLHVRRLSDDFEVHDDFTLEKVADKVIARPFHCLHFSIWNRYATKGDDAPTDVHLHHLVRDDVSRTNHAQTLPYPSRDILEH
ncbi:hypothetical protein M405DRAFT_704630, partial [Rhizopogon salebrosus TDB-379]